MSNGIRFTRRALLGTAGTTLLPAAPVAALRPGTLSLVQDGGRVHATLEGSGTWTIDARSFPGGRATKLSDADVSVEAALPGGPAFTLRLAFRQNASGKWKVGATWVGWPAARLACAPIPLENLVGPPPGAGFTASLAGSRLAAACLETAGEALRPPAAATLRLDKGLGLTLVAATGSFAAPAAGVRFAALTLAPAPAIPDWRAGAAAPLDMLDVSLGKAGAHALVLTAPAGASLSVTSGQHPIRLDGNLALTYRRQGGLDGPLKLQTAALGRAGGALECKLRFPDKPWRMRIPYSGCDVAGRPGGVGTVRASGGRVTDADLPLQLLHLGVAAPDADLTRLDFDAQDIAVVLPGTRQDAGVVRSRISLDPAKSSRVPLDKATIRLARASDLLSLKLRFSAADLSLGGDGASILPRAADPGDRPTMVAVFPPQHLSAQAFLRQSVPLPDNGAPISAADRRTLARRDEVARSKRNEISVAKRGDATDPEQLEAFKRFDEEWGKAFPAEAPWIGPDGLVSVQSRQIARQVALRLRAEAVTALASELEGPAPIDEARQVGKALALLALPEPFVTEPEYVTLQRKHGDDPAAFAAGLLKAGADRDRDFAALLASWEGFKAGAQGSAGILLFEDWKHAARWRTAKGDPLPRLAAAQARPFLARLAWQRSEELQKPDGPEPFKQPVVRVAEESRLAFDLERPLGFSVSDLTAWHGMRLRVTRRAVRSYAPDGHPPDRRFPPLDLALRPEELLRDQEIAQDGAPKQRIKLIAASVTAPGPLETAIELPARLTLSPAQDASWWTPFQPGPKLRQRWVRPDAPVPMWTAELAEQNIDLKLDDPLRSTLRAVWSPDFGGGDGFRPPEAGPVDPLAPASGYKLRFALDRLDRHDIVFLSSVHGLPAVALRGRVGQQESSQVRMPTEWAWTGLNAEDEDPALYVPRPLKVRRLALASRGGWLDHDTKFQPAIPPEDSGGEKLYPVSSLLRVRNLIVHGHDVVTETVRSGYLYPLNVEASLVRETVWRILAVDPAERRPRYAWQQVQRLFVQVAEKEIKLPAQGQPYLARGCPFRSIEVVTTQSPDLIDPTEEQKRVFGTPQDKLHTTPRGNVQGAISRIVDGAPGVQPLEGQVFWPRTELGGAGTVRFQLRFDGARDVVSMRLLFVDAVAANDPATLEALRTRYYTPEILAADLMVPAEANRIQHRGAPRAYALERRPGDTTLKTNWQEYGVTGRLGAAPDAFDSEQQAANRPPFYPVLLQAEVIPQQIEALTGQPAKPMKVEFHRTYVTKGFQGEGLEAEWFLDVLKPWPSLDMGSNADRGGGLGRQDHALAGISRQGPVGRSTAQVAANDEWQGTLARHRLAQAPSAVSDATQNSVPSFAETFFDDDAKLLGVITFKQLISLVKDAGKDPAQALPVLQETLDFGLPVIPGETADKLKAQLKERLTLLIASLQDRIREVKGKIGGATAQQGVDARSLFPQLILALDDLDGALKAVSEDLKADRSLGAGLATVWSAGQRLISELDEIARAPLGQIAQNVRRELLSFAEAVARQVEASALPGGPIAVLRDAALDWIKAQYTTGPWHDLLLSVPPGMRDAVAGAITPDIWRAGDPVAAIAAKVPGVAAEALRGPLYETLEPFARAAAGVADTGLQSGARAAMALVQQIADEKTRLARLAGQADAACANAADTLAKVLERLVPDVAAQSLLFASPGQAALAALGELVVATATLRSALLAASAGERRLVRDTIDALAQAAVAWNTAVTDTRTELGAALAEFGAARSAAAITLAGVKTCAAASPQALAALLQRLRTALSRLASCAFGPAAGGPDGPLPIAPPPSLLASTADLPSGVGAAIEATEPAFRKAAAALLAVPVRAALPDQALTASESVVMALRAIADDVGQLDALVADLTTKVSRAQALLLALDGLRGEADAGLDAAAKRTQERVEEARRAIDAALRDVERRLLGLAVGAVVAVTAPATDALDAMLQKVASAVSTAYGELLAARGRALAGAGPFDKAARNLLGPPPQSACGGEWSTATLLLPSSSGGCTATDDGLVEEAAKPVGEILARWAANQAAPQRILGQLAAVVTSGARAALLRLLDVDAQRRMLEGELRKLLPVAKTLKNSVTIPLRDKIDVQPVAKLDFKPPAESAGPSPSEPELALRSRITVPMVAALEGASAVDAEFSGTLPPFDLLVAEAVRIKFRNGVTYTGGTGRSASLSAPLGGVEFVGSLAFVSDLAAVFTGGAGPGAEGGNGPFCRVRLDRPAIEAGFRLNVAMIPLGVVFSNVRLLFSALLPLDKDPARFRLALSSLDSPFRCSVPPWGGTGFCGIEASAKRIELVEASFEFGGVAEIRYGPLVGTAFVTTGVYVRQAGDGCTIAALFSAGFAAQVACFGVSGSFLVRMFSNGGGMSGTATLRFSFSVGFASVSYTAVAQRQMGNNFKGAGAAASSLDQAAGRVQLAALLPVAGASCVRPIDEQAQVACESVTADDHWGRYAGYFDQSFRPG